MVTTRSKIMTIHAIWNENVSFTLWSEFTTVEQNPYRDDIEDSSLVSTTTRCGQLDAEELGIEMDLDGHSPKWGLVDAILMMRDYGNIIQQTFPDCEVYIKCSVGYDGIVFNCPLRHVSAYTAERYAAATE